MIKCGSFFCVDAIICKNDVINSGIDSIIRGIDAIHWRIKALHYPMYFNDFIQKVK
ncbi:hypothetical protein [Peribacillus sp. NPDC096540]|uniref:hypothetical protein n=1 Tax=Peribacillus sp. NPDC096540 TaxID=3390612 RepID=UPI003D004A13